MIYVPDLEEYKCVVVRNEEVIRAYREMPVNNSNISYRDYYYNSNYLFNDGVQSFTGYTTLPTCLDNSNLSSDVYYRNDFDKILVIFIILCFFCFYIPLKVVIRFFKKGKL